MNDDDVDHVADSPRPPVPPPRPVGYCSNCRGPLWPGDDACRACGRLVVQPETDGERGPEPRAHAPHWIRWGLVAVCALAVVLSVVAAGFTLARWSARQRADAARRERERQAHIAHSLHALRAGNPRARYASYPGDSGVVAFNATFSTCLVRRVSLKRSGTRVGVAVQLLGVQADSQAPLVNVSLYDEGGSLLSRAAIVKFLFSTLDQGETQEVSDRMDIPADGEPAIVGIDEARDGENPPPAPGAAVPAARGTYRERVGALLGSLRARGYEAYWPHEGRDDTIGVVIPDSDAPRTREGRKGIVRSVCRRFYEARRQAGRPATCRVVAQFEPSGDRFSAEAH